MRRVMMVLGAAPVLVFTMLGQATAQPDHGPIVAGLVSAAVANDDTSPSFSGFAGYRFNRAFGFGIEITSIHTEQESSAIILPVNVTGSIPSRLFAPPSRLRDVESDMTVFTTNVRLEVPTISRRVLPYLTAGGGIANVNQSFQLVYEPLAFTNPLSGERVVVPGIPNQDTSFSSLFMAVTLGGGASLFWTDHLAVDIDARCLALLGSNGQTIGRFGVGISYRF
jgi:opacity protein-like surface antigen